MSEGFPPAATAELLVSDNPELSSELEDILAKHPLEYFEDTFGLRLPELSQAVNDRQGNPRTVAAMLLDEKCPVGGWAEVEYRDNGLTGVDELIRDLSKREPRSIIMISESTRTWHAGNLKKK